MAVGQRYDTYVYTLLGELAGKPLSRLLTTAVLIGMAESPAASRSQDCCRQ
jgi:hypothetical protein